MMVLCSPLLTDCKMLTWYFKHRKRPIAIKAKKNKGFMKYLSGAYAYITGKKWEQQQTYPLAGSRSHNIEMVICKWQELYKQ